MAYNVSYTLAEALGFLSDTGARVIAGGTDFFPALGEQAAPAEILDVSRISELKTISREDTGWRIGAAVRWTQIVQAHLPSCFDGLKLAAREVGSWQIQNSGTIAGNICNASPAADGVPPLLTLNAQVELASIEGTRIIPLAEFITGVRRIELRDNEIVTAILIPDLPQNAHSHFIKLGSRKHLVISIAMVSAVVWTDADQRIEGARIAVGSCSAVATRLPNLESALLGKNTRDISDNSQIWSEHLAALSPISDVRGSKEFRIDAAQELCKRAVLASFKSESPNNG